MLLLVTNDNIEKKTYGMIMPNICNYCQPIYICEQNEEEEEEKKGEGEKKIKNSLLFYI